ncbi:chromatin assembly factor 1 subunit A-like [Panonychus citri]|uniref:chromatin assembly factor 1 subunit A-like n=1 Tax=Panonychus citri TaxID=50023 RepID=UPI0023079029|nr:chromatin assembly factor 1 subunit A-like [Panonychus citri]
MEAIKEVWVSCDPIIPLERVKIPSPCVTPEKNGSCDSSDSGDNEKCSSGRRKVREEERIRREEEKRKRLEGRGAKKREEEKKKKEEEKEEEKKRREEERKKREEEKKKKEEEKEEEKKRREEERKKREEEKEEERKRKEEEKRQKEEERKKKEAEKEEEKRKREEERKKKEEERLKALEEKKKQVEAEERKKARVSQSFISFFKRTSTGSESATKKPRIEPETATANSIFKPFQLKPFQTLAVYVPSFSKQRFDCDQFEDLVTSQSSNAQDCYINQLKSGKINPIKLSKDDLEQIKEENSSALIIEEPTPKKTYKAKFFDLSDIRPAYYGTWRKRSKIINGRKPWARDSQFFDYDVDSEEEWDGEDEEGESIASSGSDSSRNGVDDFEMDDFLVPHGHLSGDEEASEGEEEDEDEAPKKHITLIKEEDLLKARSKKVSKLKPIVIGPYWTTDDHKDADICKLLEPFRIIQNY